MSSCLHVFVSKKPGSHITETVLTSMHLVLVGAQRLDLANILHADCTSLGTHDLNARLRVGNSSVNVYFRHKFKLNLLFIRHEFAVDLLIVRHEFTKTHLWLGMSLQKLSFYQARVLSKLASVLA
ncbi:hypothetical protein F2Q69_00033718 [Brassica cretica]|uniref:Uncharacterized protein n=1 Tax=Brassica cretica TaxID=69181 RepID=A0A8S9SIL5_BRACR|nr:hypothetical protein F2Q69_00033718 [Brassica cretica]